MNIATEIRGAFVDLVPPREPTLAQLVARLRHLQRFEADANAVWEGPSDTSDIDAANARQCAEDDLTVALMAAGIPKHDATAMVEGLS